MVQNQSIKLHYYYLLVASIIYLIIQSRLQLMRAFAASTDRKEYIPLLTWQEHSDLQTFQVETPSNWTCAWSNPYFIRFNSCAATVHIDLNLTNLLRLTSSPADVPPSSNNCTILHTCRYVHHFLLKACSWCTRSYTCQRQVFLYI